MIVQPPWEDEPLHDGAVYKTHGYTRTRVLLAGGGSFDVLAAMYGERSDYFHFSELAVSSSFPQKPQTTLLEVACVDADVVTRTRATGRSRQDRSLDLRTETVGSGLKGWKIDLRSGGNLWVLAHRWRTGLRRLVFEIDVYSDTGLLTVKSVAISKRATSAVIECPRTPT